MQLPDKKIIAEWMGWELVNDAEDEYGLYYIDKEHGAHFIKDGMPDFNPDTNPEQFKEVLERLTPEQSAKVDDLCNEKYDMPAELVFNLFDVYLWISNHMPEVIQAILEVVAPKPAKEVE